MPRFSTTSEAKLGYKNGNSEINIPSAQHKEKEISKVANLRYRNRDFLTSFRKYTRACRHPRSSTVITKPWSDSSQIASYIQMLNYIVTCNFKAVKNLML